jgi:hypothetical protein
MANWFSKLVNASDPSVSLRHVGYAGGVFGSIAWLTYELIKHGMGETWVAAYIAFMGAVVTSKLVGASQSTTAAEVNAANNAPPAPAAQEAPKE